MGKKKRKRINPEDVWWCYYCDKQFADSDSLIHHQKQRHFKCHVCRKTLSTAGGMVIHVTQVHKEQVRKVPYALKGRDDLTLNIVGMDGIPQELIDAKLKSLGFEMKPKEVVVNKSQINNRRTAPVASQMMNHNNGMQPNVHMMRQQPPQHHPHQPQHPAHPQMMHSGMMMHPGMMGRGHPRAPGLGAVYAPNVYQQQPHLMQHHTQQQLPPQQYGQYPPQPFRSAVPNVLGGPPPLIQPRGAPSFPSVPQKLQVPGGPPPTLLPFPSGPPPSLSITTASLSSSSSSSSSSSPPSTATSTIKTSPPTVITATTKTNSIDVPSLPPTPLEGGAVKETPKSSKSVPIKPILVFPGTGELSMEERRAQKYRPK